jgi:hypothetical protein
MGTVTLTFNRPGPVRGMEFEEWVKNRFRVSVRVNGRVPVSVRVILDLLDQVLFE